MKRNAVITALLIALLSLSGISVYAARKADQLARKQTASQTAPPPETTAPTEPETTAPAETTQPPTEMTEPETAAAEEPTVPAEHEPTEETTLPAETTVPEETTSAEPETIPTEEETIPAETETLPPETAPALPAEPEETAPALLSEEAARLLAFQYAGVSADAAVLKKTELDHEHGRQVYEVEFVIPGDAEYEVELDAVTGELLDLDLDALEETLPPAPEASLLSVEDAKQAALADAGFPAEAVTFGKAKYEREHGQSIYEIKFYTPDGTEYEYEIDAVTGAVLKAEIDD